MGYRNWLIALLLAFAIALALAPLGDMASQGGSGKAGRPDLFITKLVLAPEASAQQQQQQQAQAAPRCLVMHRIGKTAVYVISNDPDVRTKDGCEKDTYWKKTLWLDDAAVKKVLGDANPAIAKGERPVGDAERNETAVQFCAKEFNSGNKCVHLYDYDPTADAPKKN